MKCEDIISSYIGELKEDFACLPMSSDRVRLITPYLYPDHDRIELFIRPDGKTVTISDMGQTLNYLENSGLEVIGNSIREFKVHRIAEGVGVNIERGIIVKRGETQHLGELIFDVLTACKAIGDLVYTTRAYEPALFEEIVSDYLIAEHLDVEPHVPVVGAKSGTPYRVSLKVVTPQKESLVATISPKTLKGTIGKVNATFRMWSDVNGQREKYSLLNDETTVVRDGDIALLTTVSRVFRWSAREAFLSSLKAAEPIN
jgi:hypothetical protein